MRTQFIKIAVIAIAAAILSGCETVENMTGIPLGSKGPTVCPDVSILADASEQTAFRAGAGRDLIDIVFAAQISGVQVNCDYDLDRDTKAGTLAVSITPFFDAEKGAANALGRATASYFIAVTDRDKKIINKHTFGIDFVFQGNVTKARFVDAPVQMTLPIKAGGDGRDYLVYAGFQLTREQMDYNIRKKERR